MPGFPHIAAAGALLYCCSPLLHLAASLPPPPPLVVQELVLKDHAMEPDSDALRRSAHLMVTGLAQVGAHGAMGPIGGWTAGGACRQCRLDCQASVLGMHRLPQLPAAALILSVKCSPARRPTRPCHSPLRW